MTIETLIGMGAGGVLMLIGIVVGRFTRAARGGKSERPLQAICSCEHGYGTHSKETGKCHGQVDIPTYYNHAGKAKGWKKGPCPCLHYDGPTPIEHYFATQTLPPKDA